MPRYWVIAPVESTPPELFDKVWQFDLSNNLISIGWAKLGDVSQMSREQLSKAVARTYPKKTPGARSGIVKTFWDFYHEIAIGDFIIARRGRKTLAAVGKVSRSAFCAPRKNPAIDHPHFLEVSWQEHPRNILIDHVVFPRKTLCERSEEKFLKVVGWNGGDPPQDLFLSADKIERLIALLKRNKNLVLQGPPGTGKTYLAQRLAWLLAGERSTDRIEIVQFHQSYGYEDFVRGYRPTEQGGFDLRDGPFLSFCERARKDKDPDRPHVLVIDEINRGNLSRIFGELLMLIEADKRDPAWAVRLAYARGDEPPFHVPANLYLVGAMNTADRSLALVDYALRRRFVFWTVEPAFGSQGFGDHLKKHGVPETMRRRISERLETLNDQVRRDPQLGAGFQIGHSYFCRPPEDLTGDAAWNDWYTNVVRYEIEPLLGEYWFDDTERAKKAVGVLLATD